MLMLMGLFFFIRMWCFESTARMSGQSVNSEKFRVYWFAKIHGNSTFTCAAIVHQLIYSTWTFGVPSFYLWSFNGFYGGFPTMFVFILTFLSLRRVESTKTFPFKLCTLSCQNNTPEKSFPH